MALSARVADAAARRSYAAARRQRRRQVDASPLRARHHGLRRTDPRRRTRSADATDARSARLSATCRRAAGCTPTSRSPKRCGCMPAIRRAPRERCDALLEEAGLTVTRPPRLASCPAASGSDSALRSRSSPIRRSSCSTNQAPASTPASREWLAERLRAAAADGRVVLVSTHAGQELLDAGASPHRPRRRQVIASNRPDRERDARFDGRAADRAAGARMRAGSATPLIKKELTDAIANRWLIGYAAVLGALGLAATSAGIESASGWRSRRSAARRRR